MTPTASTPGSFYDLADLGPEAVGELLALATRLRTHPEPRALEGKVLSLLFMNPSLRTLASFQSAMIRLGGGCFMISPDMSIHGLETRSGIVMDGRAAEHIRDAVPVIASYGDALAIRLFAERISLQADLADTAWRELAALADVPTINMESAAYHPCQSLADWKTLDELGVPGHRGKLVVSWAYHPRPMPLSGVISTVQMAAMRGMDVTVLRPDAYALPDAVVARALSLAAGSGGSYRETADRREAMQGAQVVFAKEWCSPALYENRLAESKRREELVDWCVDEPWFEGAAADCRFLHAMPIRRGVTATDRLLDSPRSAVLHGARNRLWTQMAVLHRMMRK
jgi:N-acetylornithine carbamoyltransferase